MPSEPRLVRTPGKLVKQGVKRARRLSLAAIRRSAAQFFHSELIGADEAEREALAAVFVPLHLNEGLWQRAAAHLDHEALPHSGPLLRIYSPSVANRPSDAIVVNWRNPRPGLTALLDRNPDLQLALGRAFPPLRDLVADRLIRAVAARNATVAALSALPEVIPSPASLIFALGEMGSDTILLSANQIGLSFELAALDDAEIGWLAQRHEIAGIMASAFGWRTLARTLVSLVPAGVGLAAKSAIAFSGTMAVGKVMWKRRDRRDCPSPPLRVVESEAMLFRGRA